MFSIETYLHILSSGFVYKTEIPTEFINNPQIQYILHNGSWFILPSKIKGWSIVERRIFRPN